MREPSSRPISRRSLLGGLGASASAAFLASILEACHRRPSSKAPACGEAVIACRPAQSDDEQTFLAIADTVVPGCSSDPSGAPGAADECVLNLSQDPRLPVAGVVSILVGIADQYAEQMFGPRFIHLSLDQRTQVLAKAEADDPLLSYAFRFFRAVHYAGLYNDVGPRSLGFPGGNLGYVDDPDFTFGRPMCAERTPDGNMP